MESCPTTSEELILFQDNLRHRKSQPWCPGDSPVEIGACFVCFGRGNTHDGATGDAGWAGAVIWRERQLVAEAVVKGTAGAPYKPALLALREGSLLEAAVKALPGLPDVLLVNATGRDHPRRAGLALHLGAIIDVPTIGVTNRPLVTRGKLPAAAQGSISPLRLEGEKVAAWVHTRPDAHPVVVHAAWRTDLSIAVKVVLAASLKARTPEPLRHARRIARTARARD